MIRINVLLFGAALLFTCEAVQAQVMPPPKKSPRTPVNSEVLINKAAMPPSRRLDGHAEVLDAERLRLNGYEVRLYGVVPPQMSATNGPQARAVVDALTQGPITCQIKDRDRDGRLLALCHNAANIDFGLELLRRGLAVSARGTLQSSDYAEAYLAAEQAAQNQRLGLWSAGTPPAASDKSLSEAAAKAAATKAEIARLKGEEAKAKLELEALTVALKNKDTGSATPALTEDKTENHNDEQTISVSLTDSAASEALKLSDKNLGLEPSALLPAPFAQENGFFERYQLLITGLLFLVTTLCVTGAVTLYRLRQKRDDIKAIAAALRGELMAARSICQARLAKIAQDNNEKTTSWPRIRTLVFQAYVGRLGLLGADLSRQIASIYGQSSDYASYYNAHDGQGEGASKRQAMESLVRHIEEVTPRLSQIEQKGTLPHLFKSMSSSALSQIASLSDKAPPLSLTQEAAASPPPDDPSGTHAPAPILAAEEKEISPEIAASLSETKMEVMAESRTAKASITQDLLPEETPPLIQTRNKAPTQREKLSPPPEAFKPEEKTEEVPSIEASRPPLAERAITKPAAKAPPSRINFAAPLIEKLAKIKPPSAPLPSTVDHQDLINFSIPDYENLTEEELEALLYAEEEFLTASPVGKSQKTG